MRTIQPNFSFQGQEIIEKMEHFCENQPLGYWQFKFNLSPLSTHNLNLGVFQNCIFYSGSENLSWSSFWQIIYRYNPRLRKVPLANEIKNFKQELMDRQNKSLRILVNQMIIQGLLQYEEVANALKTQILLDCDTYFFNYQGQAQFIEDRQLISLRPIPGFEIKKLLTEVKDRQIDWKRLQPYIPSPDSIVHIDEAVIRQQNLQEAYKTQLLQMIACKKNLGEMAKQLGKDPLSLAKVFASLVQKGSATVTAPPRQATPPKIITAPSVVKLFIVDDSPVMIKQFKRLATTIGYQVESCLDPLEAIPLLLACQPKVIFLDVNMPKLSGFQLIKQIRQQSLLNSIPVVMLTAENNSTNKFRAEWSKSRFLSKPNNPDKISDFYQELKSLLQELVSQN